MLATSAQSNRGQGHFQFSSKQKWTNYSLPKYLQSKRQQANSLIPQFDNNVNSKKYHFCIGGIESALGPALKTNMIKQMVYIIQNALTSRLFNNAIKLKNTIVNYFILQSIKAAGREHNPNKSHLHLVNKHTCSHFIFSE